MQSSSLFFGLHLHLTIFLIMVLLTNDGENDIVAICRFLVLTVVWDETLNLFTGKEVSLKSE